jgi:FAD/FMN-containing dehydrogenase
LEEALAITLEPTLVEKLVAEVRGPILLPDHPDYDEVRKVWNGMIDRSPAIIVRTTGNADVIAAVNFARENDLAVSVRGGGHSAAGSAVADDAMMIDLSLMTGVHVDAKARTARVQGGATWGIYDRECQVHGLASTGGVISTTGVGGLTLGGGLGWLMGKYGLTIDNLVSADVVTADGRLVTASEDENPDLFWALRGGSGNFGVVTSFEFRLHPVGPVITGGLVAWPVSMARETLDFHAGFTAKAPDELNSFLVFTGAPDGSGNIAAFIGCHCGSLEDAQRDLRPVKEFGPPALDALGPMPYTALQSMLDAGFEPGQQVYWKATFLQALSEGAREVLASYAEQLPSPLCSIVIEHFHGAVQRVAADATAFEDRDADFNVAIVGIWHDSADADRHITWARSLFDALQPYSTGGAYVNYMGVGDDAERIRAAYGSNYDRLAGIKQKYDPGNLFRANLNIQPRA